jgi:acetoacetyl-CoA reductase
MDKHRVALVTGGMGGLGEAICIKLAALGYTVVTTYSPGNTKAAEWLDAHKKQGLTFMRTPATSPIGNPRWRASRRSRKTWERSGAGQQRRHHARHDVQENGQGELGRGAKTNLDSCFNMTKQVCDSMAESGWGGSSTSRR